MKKLGISVFLFFMFSPFIMAQFQFSGGVTESLSKGDIYLSMVKDYRKISSIHEDQILMKTKADSLGYFHFSGQNLASENRIYRIHVDMCPESEQAINHFSGHCKYSRQVVFIAHNRDTLNFPISFNEEMFHLVMTKNDKSNALLQIDSIKNDMKFAFANRGSETTKDLNAKKWIQTLQKFSEQLQEPLAELYAYSIMSDHSNFLHEYYLQDLKSNPYYNDLFLRLEKMYPGTEYSKQYASELKADQILIEKNERYPWWIYLLGGILVLFFLVNFYIIGMWFRYKKKNEPPS